LRLAQRVVIKAVGDKQLAGKQKPSQRCGKWSVTRTVTA